MGVNTHGDVWSPLVDTLTDRFTCLTFDNRGMGQSERGAEPITVEQMAWDAAATMDAAGWPAAHIVGHSLGGPVALQLALTQRERVRSLALLCSFANGKEVGPLSWRLIWAGLRMLLGTRRMKRWAFLELLSPPATVHDPDTLAARLAPFFGHDLADQPPVVKDQMKAMRAFDGTTRLHELAACRRWSKAPNMTRCAPPKLGRAMADGIRGAKYVHLDAASHGIILTEPERLTSLLVEHVTVVEARKGWSESPICPDD